MPKKKPLARRLDRLFEDIKHEEPSVEPQAVAPAGAPQQPAAAPPETTTPAVKRVPAVRSIEAAPRTETALALDFKLSADTWATLQVLDETNQRVWTEEDQLLARQVTDQLALALENARLFQEIQRSEAELRALFASMNDVIIVYDKDGNYVRIAPTNPSLLVRPPDEMVGKNIRDVLPPELYQPFMKTIQGALNSNEIMRIEYPLEIKGSRFWFDANVSRLNETQVFWVARDITDRKTNEFVQTAIAHITESALTAKSVEELFRAVHESLQPIMPAKNFFAALYDPDTHLITFPYHADEYDDDWAPRKLGRGLTSYVIRSAKPLRVTPEIFADLEASGEVVAEGAASVDWIGVPLKSGGAVRGVMAVQTYDPVIRLDEKHTEILEAIAAQTAAALERLQAREALEQRNAYLAASAEIGRLVTSTLDLNTIFTQTVNLISDRLGFYFAAIYQMDEDGYHVILREATGGAGEKMKSQKYKIAVGSSTAVGNAAANGEIVIINNAAADRLYQPNPLLLDTQSEAAIPLKVSGKTLGVINIQSTQPHAFTPDVLSVLQSLADQVAVAINNAALYLESQELIKNLQEVDKLKSQFLASMSHELRTPLNSIIGFSRVILKGIDGPITDMQQQDLTAIYNSGQHLLGLINDILDLARIEAGKMELNFEEVHLAEMIHSVFSTAKGLVKEKPIQLIEKVPPEMPTIRGDTMRVRQILLNLISNAAKFTDEGYITVETSVQKAPSGKFEALIKVTDTGPGISPEGQEKLFKAFSQVDGSATRKTGGSGLGLSICANLVQLHGGRIGVESEEGKGSTFWFTMPLFRQPADEIPSGRKIVLAIDDDPQVISLYERYLSPQGYHVVALTEPARAKERVKELKPFAVTLDIMMPNVDGWSVLTDLKSDPATRDIPVIICSIVEQTDKGFNLGAADYLVKPILEEDLVHALDRLNKSGKIRRVLVIDDDPNDLRLIEKILTEHGKYQAILAEGGRRGWEILNTNPPDAVILDIFMPEMDGFMILEKLREEPALRDIPVLVVSGGGLTSEQHKQLAEYGKRLIAKGSLNENDLLASIESVLKRIGG
ncbi:MAG: GAF domain-containing protein [Chloroflexi bacterium]|nr:GAF domain-containing protein [Chloroflexota bacterium]